MSSIPERDPEIERHKNEWMLALSGIRDLATEAIENINEREYRLALLPLDVIRKGILPIRNAIGQWVNSMVCPACGKEGPNIAVNRSGESPGTVDWPSPHHVIDIGFKCAHCKLEWGFEVLKDAEGS